MAPSDKVNVAIVGAGGQGLHNARALFQEGDCQVMAIAEALAVIEQAESVTRPPV